MHCFCLIIHKKKRDLTELFEDWCDENVGHWDYAMIGGRYAGVIPVSLAVKPVGHQVEAPTRFNNPDYGANPECKYVSMARVRNVRLEEAAAMEGEHEISVLHPYSFAIVDYEYDHDEPIEIELARDTDMYDILTSPKYQSWYVTAVDYHI